MLSARLSLAASCALLILTPASALADTTAEVKPWGQLYVTSVAEGEANDLSVTVEDGAYLVREHGSAGVAAGSGCAATADPRAVACPAASAQNGIRIDAGPGDDTIRGDTAGGAHRNLIGGDGDDTITGTGAIDTLTGGAGADTLDGAAGSDTLNGGDGIDTVAFLVGRGPTDGVQVTLPPIGSTTANANFTTPNEVEQLRDLENVTSGSGPDQLTGNNWANRLQGGAGNDTIRGAGSADVLIGDDGDDTFVAGSSAADGKDTIDGGAEDLSVRGDMAYYGARTGPVTVALGDPGGAGTTGNGEAGEDDAITGVESAWGGEGADRLTGGSGPNVLLGGRGADILDAGAGDDDLQGGDGADDLGAGAGDDVLDARDGTAEAAIACGEGVDLLSADNALEAITRPAGCDTIAPQLGEPRLPAAPRVGDVVTVEGLGLTGDAATVETQWWSCTTADQDECEQRPDGASLTVDATELGRFLFAEVTVENAAGQDYAMTPSSAAVAAAPAPVDPVVEKPAPSVPAVEQPVAAPGPAVGSQPVAQPQPDQQPATTAQPQPQAKPRPRAVAPDRFAAVARRLLGATPVAAGRFGAVRLFTARGRGVAVVCTKGRCSVTAGGRRFTLAAGKGRRIKARKGAKVSVSVRSNGRTLKRTLRAR